MSLWKHSTQLKICAYFLSCSLLLPTLLWKFDCSHEQHMGHYHKTAHGLQPLSDWEWCKVSEYFKLQLLMDLCQQQELQCIIQYMYVCVCICISPVILRVMWTLISSHGFDLSALEMSILCQNLEHCKPAWSERLTAGKILHHFSCYSHIIKGKLWFITTYNFESVSARRNTAAASGHLWSYQPALYTTSYCYPPRVISSCS